MDVAGHSQFMKFDVDDVGMRHRQTKSMKCQRWGDRHAGIAVILIPTIARLVGQGPENMPAGPFKS